MTAAEFDRIDVGTLRRAGGVKWSMYPDAIGAFVAEMDFGTAPPITRALHEAVDAATFGYLPPALSAAMSAAYASWSADRYGWEVAPADVRPVADVVAGLTIAIEHFSTPGSPVVLPTPAYMPFVSVPPALGRAVVQVPLTPELGYDLDALDAAFAAGANLLILCNPHNPVGRVLTPEEMLAIAAVVDRHGGRVFSDEIHAPLVFPGGRHVPYASLSPVTAGHTLTATSASKAWNLPGLKCAQVVLSNDADREVWTRIGLLAEHGAANLGVIANTAAYAEGGPWLADVLSYLDGNRLLLADHVAELLPGVGYRPPEGTYLGWLDFRGTGPAEPAPYFLEKAGVAMTDGALCGDAGRGFGRLNFALPRPILLDAVERIATAMP
ncbi:MAG TPA: aminotransferase class I/II-fold pyridoxal phosphate-dependent enzyme [Mycobacteriales bacterium]|nr:aminotransferase class I/II-fold pyridoxal phosphate-dependent enzyme [Mycobacteriales bacterium]